MSADGGVPPADLTCPFCQDPLRAGAVVCRQCRRDVSIPLPLMIAQREQQAEIARLRDRVAELDAGLALVAAGGASPGAPERTAAHVAGVAGPLLGWCVALGLVVGAHWLLVIRGDAAVIVLRAACIGLPFLTALATPGLWRVRVAPLLAAGLALGLVAVALMSSVVAAQDGTPVLPTTARDLFEMLEFALSIGLSFVAGGLAMKAFRRPPTAALSRALGGARMGTLAERSIAIKTLAENGILIAATAGALVTGFRRLLE